jgi:hypothetical protein
MKMRIIRISGILLLAVILISGCSRHEKRETEEIRIDPAGKTRLVVENVSGKIIINKADSSQGILIKAEKTGMVKKRDLDKPLEVVRVEIDTLASESIYIRTKQGRNKGIFKLDFGRNKVDYNIYLPEGLKVEIENVHGEIEINDCSNDFIVENVNGSISVKNASGNNKFETVNGKFNAVLDSVKGLNVETINGSITLSLAETFKGGFEAEWVNGKFVNEGFVFQVNETDKKNFSGYIGSREPLIQLSTNNGKINIQKK